MSDNVKVSIKVRPLIKREKDSKLTSLWRIQNNEIAPIDGCSYEKLAFDHIFDETVPTRDLFDTVCRPVILSALNGINGTIFAYGQTSSGKTYTMIGDDCEPGVVPLTATEIFEQIKKIKDRQFLIRVGFIELYNEKINDLLNTTNANMKITENQCGDVVVNSKEVITNCAEQIIKRVDEGNKARKFGETNMNERSSRSHTIFRITIESRIIGGETDNDAVQIGILNLVDLAGSERADQTGTTGSRFKEGVFINRSLLSLSCVIQKLSENPDKQFINYRDSKLTRILQASLGGNAVTSMICNITPAALEETYYTLSFANRAKTIRNKPKVNEILTDAAMMKRLEREIKRLQNELRSEQNKNSKIKLVELQNAIALRTNQFISSNQILAVSNDNGRRRTWCPSSTETPRLAGSSSSQLAEGKTLMGPPLGMGSYLVSTNGMTPNIAIRTVSPNNDDQQEPNGFKATLALMGIDNDDPIPYRNLLDNRELLARPKRSVSPLGNGLLNPFTAYGEEFVPGEQISFGHISLSPLSSMATGIHTPKSLRRNRRSSTGDSPPYFDYEKRCRDLEEELTELQEFTKLEKFVELDYLKQELVNRDESLATLRGDIEEKEQRLEQLEERCNHLEIDLKDQQAQVRKAENELALAVKERQTAVRQAEQHSNQLTGIEFEYERFRQRSEAREKELIESLQEARSSSGTATPNNGDGIRLDQKREEMKRLEMQNYEFSLQLEECNKQIEQLKASYLEQQRKLEQVKQTVLQHPHLPTRGENIATQSLVESLRKLLLAREEAEYNGHVLSQQPAGDTNESMHNHSNGYHHANTTIIGDEQTVQELLQIIETLEQSVKTIEEEKKSQVQSNGVMLDELKCQLENKVGTVQHLEQQLKQWKEKFEAQTIEYDEMSTQLMDQMQESEELQRKLEAIKIRNSSTEAESEARRAEGVMEVALLKETVDKVTIERDELHRTEGTLRVEVDTLKQAMEDKVLLVVTLEKEKERLTVKYADVTKSLDEATSRMNKLNAEITELRVKLEVETNTKVELEKLIAERTTDLPGSTEKQKEAFTEENGHLENEREKQNKTLENSGIAIEDVERQKKDFDRQIKTLEQQMENDRERLVRHFSQEKESLEKANGELRLEVDRLHESLAHVQEEKEKLVGAKEAEVNDQHNSERLELVAKLEVAKRTHDTQEQRVNELQLEVNNYRSELQTIQEEYTALVEKEKTGQETYYVTQRKFEEEVELSRKTIEQLKEQMATVTKQETMGREELEKMQLLQITMEERIAELEKEVDRHVKDLETARTEHSTLMASGKLERESYDNMRQKLTDEIESSKKMIETLTEEKDKIMKRHSGEHEAQESLVVRMQELRKVNGCLEQRITEMEEEICKHMDAIVIAQKEKTDLVEQQKLERESYEAAQQILSDEMAQLQTRLDRLVEEKDALVQDRTEGIARQQSLEQQLTELGTGKDQLTQQVEEREEEIRKQIIKLDTLRAEQVRLVEHQDVTRKELEDRNATLEKELDSLQQTVEQLLSENESLLKEQLDGVESLKQRRESEGEELEKLRSCRDESERLVAQLERDLATVRAELEVVRSELLAEKQRHDESEQLEKVQIQAMASEIEQLQRSIVALEDEKRRLLEAECRLAEQLDENKRRTAELEEKKQEMESFREELRRENSDLTVAVQELSAKLVNLEEQMDSSEAGQQKTIESLVREKQSQEEESDRHEKEASHLRQQLSEAQEKLTELQEQHEKTHAELLDVRAALEESMSVRGRLEADLVESSSVRDVLERELRDLKNDLGGLDSKLAKEQYAQECQTSAKLRRELDEKHKELESFMATGRPSLGDGRVVQALRRENEDLLKQLNEARQIDGLKGKQLQERVDELQRLETEIGRLRDEMGTMRHESSFNEKEDQITQLRQKVTEVEKVREETIHQKRTLERAYDQLRFKNQSLAKEVDELRRTTDKERKSRRQSTHDDRRGLIFNSKAVGTMTEPTSTDCSCLEMDARIKELRNKLTLKDCQLNTQKLISSANPLKNEVVEMRRKLDEQNRERAKLEQELRDVLIETDRDRKERKRHCTQCIRNSRQQNARCDKAVQAYHPAELGTAVSASIVSTTLSDMGTPSAGRCASANTEPSLNGEEQQHQYDKLLEKYQTMKHLCRIRNEKIVSLGQSIVEKENKSANVEDECVKLKQQLKEAEHKYAQSQRLNQTREKEAIKSDVALQTETDTLREEMEMYRTKYERYRSLCQKLLEENKKNGQRSAVLL